MTSRNILVAMTLLTILLLTVFALRQQSAKASVSEISSNWYNSAHADRTAEAFIHWDVEDPPSVPVRCALCHSYYGFADFLGVDGSAPGTVDVEAKVGSVLFCTTCHNPAAPTYNAVEFPSGAKLEGLGPEAMCMTCHHGRQSTVGVDQVTAGKPQDTPIEKQGFINPHYFPAAATQAGGQVYGAYEYDGQSYVGRFEHANTMRTCIACHDPHSLAIDPKSCSPCHANVVDEEDLRDIRQSTPDYDGDGNAQEGIAFELESQHDLLYKSLRDYAANVLGVPITYNDSASPYFFIDTNNDGKADEQEAQNANRYVLWSPRLLRAAYNFQFVEKDPGGFVHNPKYLLQVTYDSIQDLGQKVNVSTTGMIRP